MRQVPQSIQSFLASRSIALAGVSRNPREVANAIYDKMRSAGLSVVPVNPHMDSFRGELCYSDIASIPEPPEAVFIATHPSVSAQIVRDCAAQGVKQVWFHRSIGDGSWSKEASEECKRLQIEAIEGGCPMMFVSPVDFGHRCMRWILQRTGKVPTA